MPCGETASDSAAAARSVTWVTSTRGGERGPDQPTLLVPASLVMYSSMTLPGVPELAAMASATAGAPSARNSPASARRGLRSSR